MATTMVSLQSKFQGCLVGAVAGDCLGAVFEELWADSISIDKITKLVNKVEAAAYHVEIGGDSDPKANQWEYTDDTAMARSVAKVLIENKGLDVTQLAERYKPDLLRTLTLGEPVDYLLEHVKQLFTKEYFNQPYRGYGFGVITVFNKLKDTQCLNPFHPAKEQFNGEGSYGNGGAMRICPAALFAFKYNDISKLKKLAEDITKITHSHYQAVQGAVLQAYAIDLALRSNGMVDLDIYQYLNKLIDLMKPLEDETKSKKSEQGKELPYCSKLKQIREYLDRETPTTAEEINKELGTEISALESVPAAIYAFLYSTRDIPGLEERNPVEKAIMYAISLGGDSDTIATMTGAIAGACYGIENIPDSWLKCCEGAQEAKESATKLHALQGSEDETNSDSCMSQGVESVKDISSQAEPSTGDSKDVTMASQTVSESEDVTMNSQTGEQDN